MGKWQFRARIYHWFRRVFPVNFIYSREIDNVIDLLDYVANNPKIILDLGTGIGETLPYLPNGRKRILVDFSRAMLKHNFFSNSRDRKIVADILHLPLKANLFDLVTCIGVAEYVQSKAILLNEIYCALKPEGFAIITFSPKGFFTNLRIFLGKKVFPISGSTAIDLFAAQGFFVVRSYRSLMQSQFLLQKF